MQNQELPNNIVQFPNGSMGFPMLMAIFYHGRHGLGRYPENQLIFHGLKTHYQRVGHILMVKTQFLRMKSLQVVLRAVAADRSALLYASPELRRDKVPSCHFNPIRIMVLVLIKKVG